MKMHIAKKDSQEISMREAQALVTQGNGSGGWDSMLRNASKAWKNGQMWTSRTSTMFGHIAIIEIEIPSMLRRHECEAWVKENIFSSYVAKWIMDNYNFYPDLTHDINSLHK